MTSGQTVTLGGSVAVKGTLTFTSGNITTGANTLTVGSAGTISQTSGYVIGNLKKITVPSSFTFTVGTATGYTPVTLSSVTGTGDFTVSATESPLPGLALPAKSLQHYWTLTNGTPAITSAILQFQYLQADVSGTEANYRIVKDTNGAPPFVFPDGVNTDDVDETNNIALTQNPVTTFSRWSLAEADAPTAVKLTSFKALTDGSRVVLQWKSGYEVNNLGYNVYREVGGRRTRVTPSIVAGSALLAGAGTRLTAGFSYAWTDTPANTKGLVQYYLEDIDLNGTRTMHGPITPVYDEKIDASEQAKLLSGIQTPAPLVSAWPAAQSQSANGALSKSAMLAASAEQATLAGRAAIKLGVRRDGWYRVGQAELAAAGFNTTGNASFLQLYADGVEVPLKVSGDGKHLNATDTIEFYGKALDTISSDTRSYWLVAGDANGKRIPVTGTQTPLKDAVNTGTKEVFNPLGARSAADAQSFAYTIERRDRTVYFAALQNGDGNNFFGAVVTATPVSQTLNVSNLAPQAGGAATLELTLQGATAGAHNVRVQLNNQDIGTMILSDRENKTARLAVDQSTLAAGDNTLTLTAMNGDADVSAVDRVRLTYAHAYRADNDALRFSLNNRQGARVDGFTTSQVRVFDITNPATIAEVGVQPEATENGFAINLQPSTSLRMPGARILLALADSQISQPAQIVLNEPSSLKTTSGGADLVIITHADFNKSAERLAEARRAQGLNVAVVDVQDIYDEFSYGAHSTQAITDFLAWTQNNWTLAPRFAILLGDASLDPRNYLGVGQFDFVPTKLVDTVYLETASDDTLADFDNDGIAEMAIGRLPVRTPAQAASMVSKIINYVPGGVSQTALLVSDVDPNFDFAAANATAGALLPQSITVNTIDRGQQSAAAVHSQIINGLNGGPMLVNYVGHGSTEQWAGAGLLTSGDAPALTNGAQLPLMTMMTCLNGFYQDVYTESLAEALMKAQNGGAVAVWASSGLTTPEEQALMNQELFQHLFAAQGNTLGESVHAAKSATQDRDVRRTWILFGDPTMRLR